MNKLIVFLPALVLMPVFALAQTGDADLTTLSTFFGQLGSIVTDILVPLVFSLAVVAFFWGLITTLIFGGKDESKRAEGKKWMLWSIIALAVMVLIWGIVYFLGAIFGLDTSGDVSVPKVPNL